MFLHQVKVEKFMKMDLITAGILIIFIGVIIVFIGALSGISKGESKVAVGGFIGFIPFGFANDKRLFWALLVIMAIVFAFFVFMNLKFFH